MIHSGAAHTPCLFEKDLLPAILIHKSEKSCSGLDKNTIFRTNLRPQDALHKVIGRPFLTIFKGSFSSGKQNMPINDIDGKKVVKVF